MLSLIPISDANPTKRLPVVTIGLIIANVIAFLQEPWRSAQGLTNYFFQHAPVPCQLTDECSRLISGELIEIPQRSVGSFLFTVLFSTFLHANLLHIAGNMLFLWVFGNNIEDHLGRVRYLLFYLAGGVTAAMAHVLWALQTTSESCVSPGVIESACVPAVGASGAVAAVMGAYILLYPKARVNVLVPIFFLITVVQMSAFAVLGLWFLYQFLIAAQDLAGPSGVAWMAHVGGFVFGLVMIFVLGGRPHRQEPAWARWDRDRY
ncbi:MAG TPA: rhomboid family intramembrane serine protease [Actinomycetota bacterium]|nr:rhomboid family intramembrane serine protease [Actinomycetota bacterium]